MNEERIVRCPACNPMHGGKLARNLQRKGTEKQCRLCGGTYLVTETVSLAYVDALRDRSTGLRPLTVHFTRRGPR